MPGQRAVVGAVQQRRYDPWTQDRLVVDNLGDPAGHVARILGWLP